MEDYHKYDIIAILQIIALNQQQKTSQRKEDSRTGKETVNG